VRKVVSLSIVLLGLFALSAHGTVVYSQPYDQVIGYFSDPWASQYMADDFQIPGDTTLTDVHWWGVYTAAVPPLEFDNFTINFYAMSNGTIGSLLESYAVGYNVIRTDTGDQIAGSYEIYEYDYDLPSPLEVTGGVSYAIEIYNTTGVTPGTPWAWASASNDIMSMWFSSNPSGGTWHLDPSSDLAFELTGGPTEQPIPEPLSAALFSGSVLVGVARLRRKLS